MLVKKRVNMRENNGKSILKGEKMTNIAYTAFSIDGVSYYGKENGHWQFGTQKRESLGVEIG